jgi:hypothetical protein
MGIIIKNNIVNQKGNPAWYEDTLSNRPTANLQGRMFVDTNNPSTGIYRDTGSSWVSVADPGAGTTGTLQQVTTNGSTTDVGISITTLTSGSVLFSGTGGLISQDNTNLFWDDTNNFLGIGPTGGPSALLDIHSATQNIFIQVNATSTNNSQVAFLNGGVGKWRIGNLYNSGANDFNIYDTTNALSRLTIQNTGVASITALLNISSRLNVNGASDSSYSLNVTGQGNFSSGLSIATNTVLISSTSSAPSPFNPSGVIYSSTGYGTLIGCDGQFSSKYFGISTAGNFIHVGGSATFNGTLTANGLYTSSGNGIISGGNSYYISPSSTRGVVALQGSTDNFLTFGTKGYIGVGATYMQILAQTGVALSFVSDAATVLSFALSTGVGTFANPIAIGNSVAAGVAVASTHKVSILIGGVQYYLLASNV